MDGWFPTETGCRLMGGSSKHATGSDAGEPIESLLAYVGASRQMFAGVDGNIIDITSPADVDTEPAADVTGQTSNYYSSANTATAGGTFMYAVNGTDKAQLYDGASWTAIDDMSTPAISGVDSDKLSHVNPYRNRLYFVEKDTLNVWATEPDSLGGTMVQISLAGIYRRGGSVLFTATWSLDSGDGLDDKLVIASSEGEVAVYQGSDPSDANDWSLVGLYDCPPPLGKNGYMRAGGDLVILTEQGAVPVSQVIVKDPAALALAAVSKPIQPDWATEANARKTIPWEVVKWPSHQMALITNPQVSNSQNEQCFIVNLETGAWCKRTGWAARCFVLHEDQVYFGTNDGRVLAADSGGDDDGANYETAIVWAWDHMGAMGADKTVLSARGQFIAATPFNPLVTLSADYVLSLPTPPSVAGPSNTTNAWDIGLWDEAQWDTGAIPVAANTRWMSVDLSGFAIAMQMQVTCGNAETPQVELVVLDLLYEVGEIML